jgi:hypothetical protein
MGHKLEAFILNHRAAEMMPDTLQHLHRFRLDERLTLIPALGPLYREVVTAFGEAEDNLDDMFYRLAPALAEIASGISSVAPVLYMEVDVAYGIGDHTAVVWHEGKVAYGPTWGGSHVTEAIRLFGRLEGLPPDWFNELNIFRHRFTEDWLQRPETDGD